MLVRFEGQSCHASGQMTKAPGMSQLNPSPYPYLRHAAELAKKRVHTQQVGPLYHSDVAHGRNSCYHSMRVSVFAGLQAIILLVPCCAGRRTLIV